MPTNSLKLILASASPRRQDLLLWAAIPHQILPAAIEEVSQARDSSEYVLEIALAKASKIKSDLKKQHSLVKNQEGALILAADTIVVVEGEKLGKPQNQEEAREQLLKLSGKWHDVFTGVCLMHSDLDVQTMWSERTAVKFIEIDSAHLSRYLQEANFLDKAASYAIQEHGMSFIEKIEGSMTNVVGLPLEGVLHHLPFLIEKCLQIQMSDFQVTQDWRALLKNI